MNRRQVAALPYRRSGGDVEVLVMTSRETGRFVIPKGWPMKKRKPHQAAAIEAWEEAGVQGKIEKKPLGRFRYWKRRSKHFALVTVDVFLLEVERQAEIWPEKGERHLAWIPARDAALLFEEPDLSYLTATFAARHG